MDTMRQSYLKRRRKKEKIFIASGILLLTLNITAINPFVLAAEPENQDAISDYGTSEDEAMMNDSDAQENDTTLGYCDNPSTVDIEAAEIPVQTVPPSDSQEVTNIILPDRLQVAFNPLRLTINMGDGSYSANQVISPNYEIVNKGSSYQIVEIAVTVEDLNGGQLLFVDSAEAVEAAGEETYAVYLTVVSSADIPEAEQETIPLHAGENKVVIKLPGGALRDFTFGGAMNEKADWSRLSEGVKLSIIYTYRAAEEGVLS